MCEQKFSLFHQFVYSNRNFEQEIKFTNRYHLLQRKAILKYTLLIYRTLFDNVCCRDEVCGEDKRCVFISSMDKVEYEIAY